MKMLTPAPFACAALLALVSAPAFAQDAAVVTLEAREVESTWPAEAVVEAVREATVAARVAGRVVEVRVDAGQHVRQGQLLMRLDAREAASGVAGAEAQLAQARAHLDRTRNLHAQKFVSKAALDKAEADHLAAQAQAETAGAGFSHAAVTAPISGVVARRHAELGEMAQPGSPLVTVFDPHGLRVVASVPQYRLAEVRKFLKARLEFPETGRWIDAARVEVLPTADARSHTVAARLYLPAGAKGMEGIVPGLAARAHFVTGAAKRLTVPPKAVLRRGEVTGVYVVGTDGAPRLRQVRLGEPLGNGEFEVLAGLAAGERVSLDPVRAGIRLKQPK